MKVDVVRIAPKVQQKIYEKHGVLAKEIGQVFKEKSTIYKKVGGNQYVCVGYDKRYITLFFTYNEKYKQATITTAYPSDKKQIKHYKKVTK